VRRPAARRARPPAGPTQLDGELHACIADGGAAAAEAQRRRRRALASGAGVAPLKSGSGGGASAFARRSELATPMMSAWELLES